MADNMPAFSCDTFQWPDHEGMTLRDYFAAQALANATICTGNAAEYDLTRWFGKYASGITRAQIVARQAGEYADAMLAARQESAS